LVTSDRATTNEVLIELGKRFFDLGKTPALAKLREDFLCNRRWPVLEQPGLFDQIVREGVTKGHWCLFDMGGSERVTPERFCSRETGEVPFDADLNAAGWSLVTLQGAKQRGQGAEARIEVSTVVPWVTAAIGDLGAATAGTVAAEVAERHGEVPVAVVLQAIDHVVQAGRAMAFTGDPKQEAKPERLVYGSTALLHQVTADDAVIAPAEAAKRGWVRQEKVGYRLAGAESSTRLLPVLSQLGSLYNKAPRRRSVSSTWATWRSKGVDVFGFRCRTRHQPR
jgi:hypothetical protein